MLFSTQTEGDSGKRPNTVAPNWFDTTSKEHPGQLTPQRKPDRNHKKRLEHYARAVSLSKKYVVLGFA
jgi:hypothetical protein